MAATPSSSFTILAVSLAGILLISLFLLLAYHLFLTTTSTSSSSSSCPFLHVFLTTTHLVVDSPPSPATAAHARGGLDHAAIRRIPTFRYRHGQQQKPPDATASTGDAECAVCLAEFRDGERLRLLPSCLHAFHIDCIDAWLLAAATCPLCRASLSVLSSSSPFPCPPPPPQQIHIDIQPHHSIAAVSPSPSPGEMRMRDDQCLLGMQQVQPPIRRSFSMDSSSDRHLYLALQNILLRQHHSAAATDNILRDVDGKTEQSSSSSRRMRRSFFSFSHGRSSSTAAAILPI